MNNFLITFEHILRWDDLHDINKDYDGLNSCPFILIHNVPNGVIKWKHFPHYWHFLKKASEMESIIDALTSTVV